MATRRTFLHNTAAVGAGVLLAQAHNAHATDEPGHVDMVDRCGWQIEPAFQHHQLGQRGVETSGIHLIG